MDKYDKDAVKYLLLCLWELRGSRPVTLLCRRVDV